MSLWFLPCIFTTEILFNKINIKIKNNYAKAIFIIALSIIGYIYAKVINFRLPFALDTSLFALIFYYIGYIVEKKNIKNGILEKINQSNKTKILTYIVTVVLCGILLIFSLTGKTLNMNNMNYNGYLLTLIAACCGAFFVINISILMKNNIILQFIGKNTLIIMGVHEPMKRILLFIVSKILNIEQSVLRSSAIGIILTTGLLLIVFYFIIILSEKVKKLKINKYNIIIK